MDDEDIATFNSGLKIALDVSSTAISVLICWVHLSRFYSDFFTPERLSVRHRRSPPDKNRPAYRWVSYATAALTVISLWSAASQMTSIVTYGYGSCMANGLTCWYSYFLMKLCIYYIFTLRLQLVYDGSPYQVNKYVLRGLIIVSTLWIFIELVLITVWNVEEDSREGRAEGDHDGDGMDVVWTDTTNIDNVNGCYEAVAPWFFFAGIIGYDVAINFVYYTLFILPVRRLARKVAPKPGTTVSEETRKDKSKIIAKMLVVGIKVGILSSVLVFSTIFFWALFYLAGGLALFALDGVVNTICLIFMTPYYKDTNYYHRVCYLCIFCCDRKGYTTDKYNSGDIDDNAEAQGIAGGDNDPNLEPTATQAQSSAATAKSFDTMSAPRIVAHGGQNDQPGDNEVQSLSSNNEKQLAMSLETEKDEYQE